MITKVGFIINMKLKEKIKLLRTNEKLDFQTQARNRKTYSAVKKTRKKPLMQWPLVAKNKFNAHKRSLKRHYAAVWRIFSDLSF